MEMQKIVMLKNHREWKEGEVREVGNNEAHAMIEAGIAKLVYPRVDVGVAQAVEIVETESVSAPAVSKIADKPKRRVRKAKKTKMMAAGSVKKYETK